MSDAAVSLIPMIVISLLTWAFFSARASSKARAKKTLEEAAQQVRSYAEHVNSTGQLLVVESPGASLQKGEFAVQADDSSMHEYRAERTTRGAGTKVKIGGLPVYLGKSVSESNDVLKLMSSGRIILTNKRLIFVGEKKTFSSMLADIVSFENGFRQITIHTAKRQKPIVFTVNNGFMWDMLFTVLREWEPQTPAIDGKINITG